MSFLLVVFSPPRVPLFAKRMVSRLYHLPDELLTEVSLLLMTHTPPHSDYCLLRDGARALRCACAWAHGVLPKPSRRCESLAEAVNLSKMTLPHPRFHHSPRLKQRYRCAPADHEPYMLMDTRVFLTAHCRCVTCYCRKHTISRKAFERVHNMVQEASRTVHPSLRVPSWAEFNEFQKAMYWSRLCFELKTPVASSPLSVSGDLLFSWVNITNNQVHPLAFLDRYEMRT